MTSHMDGWQVFAQQHKGLSCPMLPIALFIYIAVYMGRLHHAQGVHSIAISWRACPMRRVYIQQQESPGSPWLWPFGGTLAGSGSQQGQDLSACPDAFTVYQAQCASQSHACPSERGPTLLCIAACASQHTTAVQQQFRSRTRRMTLLP